MPKTKKDLVEVVWLVWELLAAARSSILWRNRGKGAKSMEERREDRDVISGSDAVSEAEDSSRGSSTFLFFFP